MHSVTHLDDVANPIQASSTYTHTTTTDGSGRYGRGGVGGDACSSSSSSSSYTNHTPDEMSVASAENRGRFEGLADGEGAVGATGTDVLLADKSEQLESLRVYGARFGT
jgi:hypothetical protein